MQHQAITPAFGTLVEDIDIARLAPEEQRGLYELWQRRHLLVLRDTRCDRAALAAFAAAFGQPETMDDVGARETAWDTEQSWAERPPFACMLRCMEAPARGGASWFACLSAALQSMAPDLATRLRWLALEHRGVVHPMVVMHPETGEPALYLGSRRNARIPGVPEDESERLLNIVWSYATAASVTLCHRWQPGDVLVWNNLMVAHRHDLVPPDQARVLQGWRVRGRYTLAAPIQQEAA